MEKFINKEDQFKKIEEWDENHWWHIGRRKIFVQLIRKSVKLYIKPAFPKLLDIGCGFGYLVDRLSKEFNTVGIDDDKLKVSYLKRKKINAIYADANKLPFQDNQFDIIVAFDVLEHIKNDAESLTKWNNLLKKEGVLCISVPMFNWMWGVDDIVADHYRRYSKKEISEKLKNAGFQIRYSTYYNFFLFPIIALIRIFKKIKLQPSKMSQDEIFENLGFHTGGKVINKLLSYVFRSESFFLRFITFPFGVSSFFICTKQ